MMSVHDVCRTYCVPDEQLLTFPLSTVHALSSDLCCRSSASEMSRLGNPPASPEGVSKSAHGPISAKH